MAKEQSEKDFFNSSNKYYGELLNEYGRDPRSLGWIKGRQAIRFAKLTEFLGKTDIDENFTLLDYGCGFGDLYLFLQEKYPNMNF